MYCAAIRSTEDKQRMEQKIWLLKRVLVHLCVHGCACVCVYFLPRAKSARCSWPGTAVESAAAAVVQFCRGVVERPESVFSQRLFRLA